MYFIEKKAKQNLNYVPLGVYLDELLNRSSQKELAHKMPLANFLAERTSE